MQVSFHNLDRQAGIIEAAKVPASVAVALDCWASWMRTGRDGRGYPSKSCGFATGGIGCWDDLDESNSAHMAIAADGAIKGLEIELRTCIGIVWLGHSPCTQGIGVIDVDAVAVMAVKSIYRGLLIRGAL